MRLEQITPVILTFNEAANIDRTLGQLRWARRIIVVDSYSDDDTCTLAAAHPAVVVFRRRFDSHAAQWNFAVGETGIDTEWTLALDADYFVTDKFVRQLEALRPLSDVAGFKSAFVYCINGIPLRGAAYTPVNVLFRTGQAVYDQDGHTQRVRIKGRIETLAEPLLHDDRKPLRHWLLAQIRYQQLEAKKLQSVPISELGGADRLRRMILVAPPVMLFYCLFVKGNIFDGRAGLFYALQRTLAELVLSLFLLERSVQVPR